MCTCGGSLCAVGAPAGVVDSLGGLEGALLQRHPYRTCLPRPFPGARRWTSFSCQVFCASNACAGIHDRLCHGSNDPMVRRRVETLFSNPCLNGCAVPRSSRCWLWLSIGQALPRSSFAPDMMLTCDVVYARYVFADLAFVIDRGTTARCAVIRASACNLNFRPKFRCM